MSDEQRANIVPELREGTPHSWLRILDLRIPESGSASVRPRKTPPDDTFHDQVIGRPRRANTHTKVELPLRTEVDIDRWKELLLLIFERVEAVQ